MDTKALIEWAANQGPGIAILVAIIIFGYKQFTKFIARLHKENQEAWKAATGEREGRFKEMQSRFESSDRRHEICEEDRAKLHDQMIQILLRGELSKQVK